MAKHQEEVYRLTGLSCASCAVTFEKNVRNLNGVSEAKVNFGASKITITGAATVADIEKAGAFDGIKIVENNQSETFQKKRLWQGNLHVIISALLILAGLILQANLGSGHPIVTSAFLAAMVIA